MPPRCPRGARRGGSRGSPPPTPAPPPRRTARASRDVEAVGQEGPIAGVRLLLGLHPADREDHLVRLTREEIAAAGTSVAKQADPGRATALDLGAVGRRRAGHHRLRLLLDPSEGRDVLVGAEQDPCLAGSGLRGEVRLPLAQAIAVLGDPAGEVRGAAVPHRVAQDRQPEPVDLEVEDPWGVTLRHGPLAARRLASQRAACTHRRRWSRSAPGSRSRQRPSPAPPAGRRRRSRS